MNDRVNDPSILNEFFETNFRFMYIDRAEDDIGPFRCVSDMEEEVNFIFVTKSPEVF